VRLLCFSSPIMNVNSVQKYKNKMTVMMRTRLPRCRRPSLHLEVEGSTPSDPPAPEPPSGRRTMNYESLLLI